MIASLYSHWLLYWPVNTVQFVLLPGLHDPRSWTTCGYVNMEGELSPKVLVTSGRQRGETHREWFPTKYAVAFLVIPIQRLDTGVFARLLGR